MMHLRRVEFPRGGSALAHQLIICRSVSTNRCFCSIALAGATSRSLGAPEPPQAKTKHDRRRNDAEARRRKWRRAEERHRDGVLDRWRARQSRHGEGRGAKHDRCRHQPARHGRGAKQRLCHGAEHEEGDEQAHAAIGYERAREYHRDFARRSPKVLVMKSATADTEPLSSMSLPKTAPRRKIGKN